MLAVAGGVGYLIDLSSKKEPRLYLVENELAVHDPLKHIAAQILNFSLSFETSPQKLKSIIKDTLGKADQAWKQCQNYAIENGFENIDFLLEKMIYGKDAFNALVAATSVTIAIARYMYAIFCPFEM